MRVDVELTVRNGHVRETLKALGWTQAELARRARVHPTFVGDLVRLRHRGKYPHRSIQVQRVAETLGLSIDQVVPPETIGGAFRGQVSAVGEVEPARLEAALASVLTLGPHEENPVLAAEERADTVRAMLEGCRTDQQRTVLELRHGLDGEGDRTLAATARELGLSVERIRQVEASAHRAIRGHARRRRSLMLADGYREVEDLSNGRDGDDDE